MDEVIELSSDSNDTIINQLPEQYMNDKQEDFYNFKEFDEHDLNLKHISENTGSSTSKEDLNIHVRKDNLLNQMSESTSFKIQSSISDVDNLLKELHTKYLLPNTESENANELPELNLIENEKCQKVSSKRKSVEEGNGNKLTKKQMLELDRNKRKLEKQHKKELSEKAKAMKVAFRSAQKSINPDECLKNITVRIDENLFIKYGHNITEKLKTNNISHKSVVQICGDIISWRRQGQTIENLVKQVPVSDEKHYLLVIPSAEFKALVDTKNLNTHIHSIALQVKFEHLTIAVFGIDKLSDEQEYAVMEVEMFYKCYWQFVTKLEDLASLIFIITKAIAQIPYKLEKQETYRLQNEYFADCNKDTVRVDKNGNGLARLWNQMLTMLPLARLETAEAISSVYPTPSSLFKAYEECESDREKLLQDLPIKRANGPITSSRKIGPELSKKCARFFTSTENVYI